MDLSPAPAFHFPSPGGDGQSLQRHRSTSTPNVHMVSTVGPAGASIIEVCAVGTEVNFSFLHGQFIYKTVCRLLKMRVISNACFHF